MGKAVAERDFLPATPAIAHKSLRKLNEYITKSKGPDPLVMAYRVAMGWDKTGDWSEAQRIACLGTVIRHSAPVYGAVAVAVEHDGQVELSFAGFAGEKPGDVADALAELEAFEGESE